MDGFIIGKHSQQQTSYQTATLHTKLDLVVFSSVRFLTGIIFQLILSLCKHITIYYFLLFPSDSTFIWKELISKQPLIHIHTFNAPTIWSWATTSSHHNIHLIAATIIIYILFFASIQSSALCMYIKFNLKVLWKHFLHFFYTQFFCAKYYFCNINYDTFNRCIDKLI